MLAKRNSDLVLWIRYSTWLLWLSGCLEVSLDDRDTPAADFAHESSAQVTGIDVVANDADDRPAIDVRPEFISTAACPVPGTLAYHLTRGPGRHWFHYDPAGVLATRIKGRYEDRNGRFYWTERYHREHYRRTATVRGNVRTVGDIRVLNYRMTTRDIRGRRSAKDIEELWHDCQVTRHTRPAGQSEAQWRVHEGRYDRASRTYTYTEEQRPLVHGVAGDSWMLATGVVFRDGTWVEELTHFGNVNYSQTRTGATDGVVRLDWHLASDATDAHGHDTQGIDGALRRHLEIISGDTYSEVDLALNYQGYGTGRASYRIGETGEQVACTVTLAPGSCDQTCDDGEVASCPCWLGLCPRPNDGN